MKQRTSGGDWGDWLKGCEGLWEMTNVKFPFLLPVLLADKEIEGVLRPQEVVIIQDFHRTHPVGIEVTRDLLENKRKR